MESMGLASNRLCELHRFGNALDVAATPRAMADFYRDRRGDGFLATSLITPCAGEFWVPFPIVLGQ